MPDTSTALYGRIFKWTFKEGPTAGGTYEHAFDAEGVAFRKVDSGSEGGKATRATKVASYEVAPSVHLVSYLAEESGYTLTVAMNLETKRIYGFASGNNEWHPVSGTLDIVK